MNAQRGFALVEAVVVVGIAAMCAGTLVLALAGAAKFGAHAGGPHRIAALLFARQTLRIAQNAWKYGPPGSAPAGTAGVSIPVAGPQATATAMPARISATIDGGSNGASLSITVSYPPDSGRADPGSVTLSGPLRVIAPLPGSQVERAGLIAQPAP